ncbi:MAG: BMP family protein [Sphaerochaetaceae bacterium]
MKKVTVILLIVTVALASVFAGGAKEQTTDGTITPSSMALILSGPANDQGWNAVAVSGLEATAAKFGFKTTIMENVDIASSEAAFRQLAAEGYDIVIGHGYQYGEPAAAVSSEFPNKFFLATEADSYSDNAASYVMACEQGAYVMGLLSASMSRTKTIGVIGGFEQPSITKELEAFKLAAQTIDPSIKVLEIYINSFTDTNLGYEAAVTMINRGADVVYQVANQAGNGALIACAERGIYCAGNSYDQNSIAPDYVLSSTIYNMDQVMITAVSSILDGTFKGGVYNLGMDKGVVEIAGYHGLADKIPQSVKDLVAQACDRIKSGELEVPIISSPTK